MEIILIISFFFFFIGLFGITIMQKNFLIIILCLELMIVGCALIFLTAAKLFDNPNGQIFALLIITISTAETAIGLSLFIKIFKIRNTMSITNFSRFKY
jgi:NADH-quinone oxidoreductase subunit K